MHIETLVRMANDIGSFFNSEPDKQEVARNIKAHIRRYWEPRMRSQIIAHYRAGGEGLNETSHAAIALLASEETAAKPA
jgi:formate dehydrogenase subunit delta